MLLEETYMTYRLALGLKDRILKIKVVLESVLETCLPLWRSYF